MRVWSVEHFIRMVLKSSLSFASRATAVIWQMRSAFELEAKMCVQVDSA